MCTLQVERYSECLRWEGQCRCVLCKSSVQCLFVNLSVHLCDYTTSVYMFICLSVCLSVCLSLYLSVYQKRKKRQRRKRSL